ncbi:MAG: gamma-glutamyltransferase family protein [Planctomycetota bacterium]|nr:gamma-glutamyltransferase family protein [Planctomycetota bacterium]
MTVLATATLLSSFVGPSQGGDRVTGLPFATRSEVIAPKAMAATSQPLATQVALDVMKAGGNAVDAAIAANAALGLMEPTGNGMGGDLFAIVWDAGSQQLFGLNGSGRSPAGQSLEDLQAKLTEAGEEWIPSYGALPVTVPGCVDGWFTLHERFGRMPMDQVLSPAVRYAREGFPVSQLIAYYWQLSTPRLSKYPGFVETFTRDGRPPGEGELWTNLALAETLERLGAAQVKALAAGDSGAEAGARKGLAMGPVVGGGRDLFYQGDMAEVMVRCLQENGAAFTLEDFAGHRSEWVEPVSTSYRGARLWELPPNGQGIAALQILNLLEPYDLKGMGFGSADFVHHFVEAKKLAFADRARLYADPATLVDPEALVAELISKPYADRRRALIDPERAALSVDAGLALPASLEQGDTIYLTVADEAGNMVSLIQSNYRGMGSGLCPPGLGFGFQDRGELFDLTPGRPNSYAPSKRPFHTIIPAFVTRPGADGQQQPWISFGVMGGATQPQAHAQVLINLLDFGMNLQEAGDAARILHTGSSQPTGQVMDTGGYVSLESGYSAEVRAELEARGHVLRPRPGSFGGYQAILRQPGTGVYHGASESRKDGQAAGY